MQTSNEGRLTIAEMLQDSELLHSIVNGESFSWSVAGNEEIFQKSLEENPMLLTILIDTLLRVNQSLSTTHQIKAPFVVCEMFSLLSNETLKIMFSSNYRGLRQLLSYTTMSDLNPTSTGYFSRVLNLVVQRNDEEVSELFSTTQITEFFEKEPHTLEEIAKLNHFPSIQEVMINILALDKLSLKIKIDLLNYMVESLHETYDSMLVEGHFETLQELIDRNPELIIHWVNTDSKIVQSFMADSINYEFPQAMKVLSSVAKHVEQKGLLQDWVLKIAKTNILTLAKTKDSINPMDPKSTIPVLGLFRLSIAQTIESFVRIDNKEIDETVRVSAILGQLLVTHMCFRVVLNSNTRMEQLIVINSASPFRNVHNPTILFQLCIQEKSLQNARVNRGYQQFFVDLIRFLQKQAAQDQKLEEYLKLKDPEWQQMIQDHFTSRNSQQESWLLNMDPSKPQKQESSPDRIGQLNISNAMIQKYLKMSQQWKKDIDNEPFEIEVEDEDPDLAMQRELEEGEKEEAFILQSGDDGDECFIGRNSFGFRHGLVQEEEEAKDEEQQPQATPEIKENDFSVTTFWRIQICDQNYIKSILDQYD